MAWEHPMKDGNDMPPVSHLPDDVTNYVLLLRRVEEVPFKVELSVAALAGPTNYSHAAFGIICSIWAASKS
ncbi:hypothetical protein H257_19552 [Aphanomyces astaci]|uniref:Uncharacterized protein n=1 Tax=Aphanomyces astaci TaxID=112090 RepID=W4F9D0_APHAT|nr:hypothetical protein H257_19552 [Aphanomyces astaci]ETV63524.1 hypothetical protein H257_19552 [Aphanomyces astaci]|eukprot:XP_009846992.1 hypothetical protein H257_19552 [Aphanomyces astaci]